MRCPRFPKSAGAPDIMTTFLFYPIGLIVTSFVLLIFAIDGGGICMLYSAMVTTAVTLLSYVGDRVERIMLNSTSYTQLQTNNKYQQGGRK